MHELPATQGMLEVALDAAREAGAIRIREIHLVVGELTSMVDDSVQFYFDIIARGTMAEGAQLVFTREAAVLTCHACGHSEEVVPPLRPTCPACESLRLEVTGGQAFRVESLDVDTPEQGSGDRPTVETGRASVEECASTPRSSAPTSAP